MRVPTIGAATVQNADPYGNTAPNLVQPDYNPAQTIAEVGKDITGVGQAIGGVMAEDAKESAAKQKAALEAAEAEKKRARELTIADGVVDVQRRANDDEVKFRSQQGLGALKASGPALDGLDKHIDEVGARFTDPLLRAEFNVRAKQAILGSRKSIEEHTSKQYGEGIKQTYGNLRDGALRTASTVELSPEEMKSVLAPVDQGADEFMSAEDAKKAKLELRGDVSEAVIARRIAEGQVDEAESQLQLDRSLLGEKREKALKGQLESKRKDITAKSVAVQVNNLADGVRDENNIVTGQALSDALPKVAEDDPRREAFETAIEKQRAIEDKRLKELLEVEKNNASNAINDGVTIPDQTLKRLKKYDREALEGLLAKAEARKHARALDRRGNRQEIADERRFQAEINGEAEERFAALLKQDPNASHKDFIVKFTRDVSAREGRPVTVSPRFEAKLENDSATERQKQNTNEGRTESKFSSDVEKAIDGMTILKKGGKPDEALTRSWGGYAALRYQAAVQANGGKPLNAEQSDKLSASIINEAVADNKKGKVMTKPPAALGPTYEPALVGKKVRSYGYSIDGKKRIPRYTDGSLGPPEEVP